MIDIEKYDAKLEKYISNKKIDHKDLKEYVTSLAILTSNISKDATTYATVAPTTKKWISAFKPIFGNHKFNQHCSTITVLCSKLLKFFCQFEQDHSHQFYCDWRDLISSTNSTKRAEAFIAHIREFKIVIKHLQTALNRWNQLIILAVLRSYTKSVKWDDIKKLNLKGRDNFLDLIRKIISLQNYEETSVRAINTFLSDMNSKGDNITSFQPYKIVFENEVYIVTDYELWIDCNIKNKLISFVALSLIDKKEKVFGVASTTQIKLVSNEDYAIIITSNWHLSTKSELVHSGNQMDIMFYFSPRIHNSILESKLKNVFDIITKRDLSKDSFLKTVVGATTSRMADELMLSSFQGIGADKLRITAQLAEIREVETINKDTMKHTMNQENTHSHHSQPKTTEIDEIQQENHAAKSEVKNCSKDMPSALKANEEQVRYSIEHSKSGTKEPLVSFKNQANHAVKKRFRKRRRNQGKQADGSSSDSDCGKKKRDKRDEEQLFKKLLKCQSMLTNKESVHKTKITDANTDEVEKVKIEELNVEFLALSSNQENKTIAVQKNLQCVTDKRKDVKYDLKLVKESWPIRNFLKSLHTENQEEVDENEERTDNETKIEERINNEMEIDEIYESVSHRYRIKIK